MTTRIVSALVCSWVLAASAAAQPPPPTGTLDLATLEADAQRTDPRAAEVQLQAEQSDLRLRSLASEWLPSIAVTGQTQYQSDVPRAPVDLPSGQPLFAPPKDTYDASISVEQRLYDPTAKPREAVERAQLAQTEAGVRTSTFGIRQEVDDAFFQALLLQEQARAVDAATADLAARLDEARIRVREGAALPADAASIEAALLVRRRDAAEIAASRRAALARLGELTGRTLPMDQVLTLPDLGAKVSDARAQLDTVQERPEYRQFATARNLLSERADATKASVEPRVTAYGKAGYGKPGLNFIDNKFQSYWLAGVRVQWTPWDHGSAARTRAELGLQQSVVDAEQAAFTSRLRRSIENVLADIDRLEAGAPLDDQIVTLREQVAANTQVRLNEGAVTAADYVDRNTDLLSARIARSSHQVQLQQAGARLLDALGLEVR
jgi:outer membrane protein TolC